jgi:hypothetical protein
MLKKIPINRKQLVFEQDESLLDEGNLKEWKSLYIYKKAYRWKLNILSIRIRAYCLNS